MTEQATRTELATITNKLGYGVRFTGRNAQLARVHADFGRGEEIVRGPIAYVLSFVEAILEDDRRMFNNIG